MEVSGQLNAAGKATGWEAWEGPREVAKRKIPSPPRESNPRTPIVQPAALLD